MVWRGDTGDLREVTVAGGVSGVELAIPKRPGLAVLAYPSFAGGAFITRPAAAVYPHDMVAGTRLAASYARGFTGLVLHRVLFALPSVNSGRLIDEVSARSEGNPWSFDLERVVRKVADGRFSTIYLRPRDAFAVEVEVGAGAAGGSAASAWLPHNPLADVVVATDSPEGSMLRTELPPGHHHLMGVESGCILSVVVEEDGSYRVFRR